MTTIEQLISANTQLVIKAADLQALFTEWVDTYYHPAMMQYAVPASEACKVLGVGKSTLLQWARDGKISSINYGDMVRFELNELERFKTEHKNIKQQLNSLKKCTKQLIGSAI